jgi:hypothetical protein
VTRKVLIAQAGRKSRSMEAHSIYEFDRVCWRMFRGKHPLSFSCPKCGRSLFWSGRC